MNESIRRAIDVHVVERWPDHVFSERRWAEGPVFVEMPDLRILEAVPNSTRTPVVYVTRGASDIRHDDKSACEFFLFARKPSSRHVELLSMLAYMHRNSTFAFEVGSIVQIGRPWEPGSHCDRIVLSLPYAAGKAFEYLRISQDFQIRFLWVIPISREEEDFCLKKGLDALEDRFDEMGINYVDPNRPSAV